MKVVILVCLFSSGFALFNMAPVVPVPPAPPVATYVNSALKSNALSHLAPGYFPQRRHVSGVFANGLLGRLYGQAAVLDNTAIRRDALANALRNLNVDANVLGGSGYFSGLTDVSFLGDKGALSNCVGVPDGVYTHGKDALVFCNHGISRVQSCPAGTYNSLKDIVHGSVVGTKQMLNLCGVSEAEVAYLGL